VSDRHSTIIALVIAVGLATAFNLITFAVLYDAIRSQGPGLSDNATQVLTGLGGGMIGILGSIVGYRAGASASTNTAAPEEWPTRELPKQ
jgi:hypothetical protein